MEIKLSRHSKNNMRLYDITREDIMSCITSPDREDTEGNYSIAYKNFSGKFSELPLKVVYVKEDSVFVITAYPLRKNYWR